VLIIGGFWLLLSLALPYLAKGEEQTFRGLIFGTKKRIITSIKFGLVHMIVGVPLFIALILAVVGYIFSIFYVKAFNKAAKVDPYTANEVAINVSTSVHAKYNFLIIHSCEGFTCLYILDKSIKSFRSHLECAGQKTGLAGRLR
jgi:hypothetical protein